AYWLSSGLAAIQGAKAELQKAATPGHESDGVIFELRLVRYRPLATYHRWPAEQPLKRSGAQVVPPQMCCDDKYCRHGCADHIAVEKGLGTGADQQRQYEQVSNIDGQRQPTSGDEPAEPAGDPWLDAQKQSNDYDRATTARDHP